MSTDDSVTAEQLDALKESLSAALGELEATLAASSTDAKPVDLDLSIGRLSRVDAIQQQQIAMARQRRGGVRRQLLRAALQRMVSGTYGACLKCEEPIGYARLNVSPEAPFCMRCQGTRDA